MFFRQERIGKDRVPFEVVTFRSMVSGAYAQEGEVATLNMHAGSDATSMFKVFEDSRVAKCK